MTTNYFPPQDKLTLRFKDQALEKEFTTSYDKSVRVPLRMGIIISILSWYSAISLVYLIIPEQLAWLGTVTLLYIGSYFGFIIYATYSDRFKGYYHLLGAISNAWAGLFTIYFSSFFPTGQHLILPVIIFIIFFGSYMIRLRWLAGFIAALSYILTYQGYIILYADLSTGEVLLYSFVSWMVLIFAVLAGRTAENNYRIAYIQRQTIRAQNKVIEQEKELLLKEVHHRVQNNLQMIISLMNMQMRKMEGMESMQEAETCDAMYQIQGRVMSMSLVHQRIHQTSNFSKISLREYAENLNDSIASNHRESACQVELDIPESIQLDIEQAIPLGLILNEMLAASYQADCGDFPSLVHLSAAETASGKSGITLVHPGRKLPENHTESLEFELIEILTEQLDGTLNCTNDAGVRYEITI